MTPVVWAAALFAWCLLAPRLAAAQPPPEPEDHAAHLGMTSPASGWTWSVESNVFAGYNRQDRKFRDFSAWESQNWIMALAERRAGPWRISAVGGGTLEPFTIDALGSPQAFQTGETYQNAPLIDYQHPHDLVMHLGAEVGREFAGNREVIVGAALVGGPPIGPPAFMHRTSALENPQVPLSHHQLDATHITHGLVLAALRLGGWRIEGAAFHGQEPDEQRTDLDTGALDSQAVQLAYTRGGWSAQVSQAWLTRPERLSTYDAERRTASLQYARTSGARRIAWTLALGQNREAHGDLEALLFETVVRPSRHWAAYARVEWLDKDILDAGFHPIGVGHVHRQSRVGAFTLGGVRDLVTGAFGRVGIGADVTAYRVPANLAEAYGRPLSAHLFVRYYGRFGTSTTTHRH